MLLQSLINGLLLGGIYSVIGVGFSLVYGVMSIINLAHGSFIMIGSYIALTLFEKFHIDPFLAIIPSMMIMFVLGYGLQYFVLNRVIKYGLTMIVVLTFGLDLVLINIVLLIWSPEYRLVSPSYSGMSLQIGNITIPYIGLAIFGISVVLTIATYLFLNRTRYGKAVRATSLHKEAAQLAGVEISRIYSITFALSAALAGAAGAMFSTVFSITPFMGAPFLGKAFAIAVLGGLGNVTGAVYGGLILGVAEALGAALLGPEYQQIVGYVLLLVVLIVMPQGLMGRRYFT
ncbi:branched-chain amino acid ABC transporter permease [Paradesulfitobacterium aromaticivorans]